MKFSRNVPVVLSLILLAAVLTTCLSPFASVKEQGDFVITIGADINSRAVTDYPPKGITGITGGADAPDIADLRFSVTFTPIPSGAPKYFEKQGTVSIKGSLDQGDYTVRTKVFLSDGTPYAQGGAIDNPVYIKGGAINQITVWVYSVNDAEMPFLSAKPRDAAYSVGDSASALYANASVTDGGTLTYQWYRNTTASNTGGTPITGLNTNSYTPSTATAGTFYYYVAVTNNNNNVPGSKTATVISNTATVTVTVPGDAWIAVNSPFTSSISGIAYAEISPGVGRFVAYGDSNKMAYSADGVTWTAITSIFGSSVGIDFLGYISGKFVALSHYYDSSLFRFMYQVAYSADGATWTVVTDPLGSSVSIESIVYSGGRLFATGYDPILDEGKVAYSADGVTWTAVTSPPFAFNYTVAIAYGNGKFVAAGYDDNIDYVNQMAYSVDGVTWTAVTSPFGSSCNILTIGYSGSEHGSGLFFAIGDAGTFYSTDGIAWTDAPSGLNFSIIAYGGGRYVASLGWNQVAYSSDCITWTAVPTNIFGISTNLTAIVYGNGKFVATSGIGRIAYSTDGIIWTSINGTTSTFGTTGITGIVYGGGRFIAWGGNKMAWWDK